jgi:solute carrier family 25 carnitine/acylcarnitine transporter 20/29
MVEEAVRVTTATASTANFSQIWVGLLSGCVAGAANVLIGHPFDTAKVRMQVSGRGLAATVRNLILHEGVAALYKGVRPAFYNVPFIYASYFAAYEAGKLMQGVPLNSTDPITLRQSFIAGCFSGIPVCLLLTPTELIKCRLQVEGMDGKAPAHGPTQPWQLVRQIIHREGLRGLYKGNLITVAREIPSGGAIYVAYDISKNLLDSHLGALAITPLLCGALGGIATTAASYPQDVIKTNIQVAQGHTDARIPTIARDIFQREGFRGFWRGFFPAATRAILVESVTFLVYDFMKTVMDY